MVVKVQRGEWLELPRFVGAVFVDAERRGEEADHAALGGMQRGGAAGEARGEAPALQRPIEQQGEAGVTGHGR